MKFKDVHILGIKCQWNSSVPETCVIPVFPFEVHIKRDTAMYGISGAGVLNVPGVQSGMHGTGDYEWTVFMAAFQATKNILMHTHFNETLEEAVKEAEMFIASRLAELGNNIAKAKKLVVVSEIHNS